MKFKLFDPFCSVTGKDKKSGYYYWYSKKYGTQTRKKLPKCKTKSAYILHNNRALKQASKDYPLFAPDFIEDLKIYTNLYNSAYRANKHPLHPWFIISKLYMNAPDYADIFSLVNDFGGSINSFITHELLPPVSSSSSLTNCIFNGGYHEFS